MPTGYTSYIGQGCDFKTFAMKCARAFGACIDMRDSSLDAQIPDSFEPSRYHLKEKRAAERKFKKISKFKKSDWEKLFKKSPKRKFLGIKSTLMKRNLSWRNIMPCLKKLRRGFRRQKNIRDSKRS